MSPIIAGNIDVAALVLYAFFLFFICLVFYLRREDRREGYPLEDDLSGRIESAGGPLHSATAKTFRLPFGRGTVTTPTKGREPVNIAVRRERFPGAPSSPSGNPLIDGIGPAAWADRAKLPDLDVEGDPRVVPISTTNGSIWVEKRDPDPRGMTVTGADGVVAGTVTDLWVDRADRLIRYLSVSVDGGRTVLAPMTMAKVDRRRRNVHIDAINAAQFAGAPVIAEVGSITLYEEERVQAYFGGGYLYANASRSEPWL